MKAPAGVLELRSVRGTGGGPEKTILFGTELADRTQFAVTICYLRDIRDTVFGIDARARQLNVDYVEVRERHSFDPSIWRTLKALVRDKKIDIVHAHDYKTNFLAFLLSRRLGVIPLSTAHGYTGQSTKERYLYYPLDRRLLARFPRVIAVSSELKEDLVRHGAAPARLTVILNSINSAAFTRDRTKREQIRRMLGYVAAHVVIGAVGRLEIQKRFDLLLEAAAPLLASRPNLRLAIVGDGSLKEELMALAGRLNLTSQCAFLGHRDDVAELHNAFDLFVQSSEYEGTPNAVLEAMAMETPIVATDVGGTRELAHPDAHALIVPSRNVEALKDAMQRALDDPAAMAARARRARERVVADLSFEARTRRLEEIYRLLLSERGGRGRA